jgi:hypothetical protein
MIFGEILLLNHATGSQIIPLHFATGRCNFLLYCAVGSQILPLQNAWGKSNLTATLYMKESNLMGSKRKNL